MRYVTITANAENIVKAQVPMSNMLLSIQIIKIIYKR